VRIKYKKGTSPDLIVAHLRQYFEETIIGSVNVYIQEYDENMKARKDDAEYLVFEPGDVSKERYADYAADQRRKRMKVVV
jgi:hypothetical protein